MQADQSKKQVFEKANAERKRQIVDDTTKLLELATQLKSEVDKTSKDTLSIDVIKKAESIEKLAHGVKEKMKSHDWSKLVLRLWVTGGSHAASLPRLCSAWSPGISGPVLEKLCVPGDSGVERIPVRSCPGDARAA